MSRSVQIWVTSNLWWEKRDVHINRDGHEPSTNGTSSSAISGLGRLGSSGKSSEAINATSAEENRRAYWKRWSGGGKWGGRRWDWKEVGLKCVLPAGILYFITAWAEQLRREWSVCWCLLSGFYFQVEHSSFMPLLIGYFPNDKQMLIAIYSCKHACSIAHY